MRSEVYSWRVAPELKTNLEREARRRGKSLSAILDMAAEEWLTKSAAGDGEGKQRELQKAASECFGLLASGNTRRSETVRQAVRTRLRQRHGR